ncbi:MAG: type pilus assembly protein PilB [Eubacteriales bacterium]|nr:type pilus assembly protein PilB [Eubacteriales bacterium]
MENRKGKKMLGELLVEAGVISEQQLKMALDRQKLTGERLGKILIEKNYVSEQTILDVLEKQLGVKQVSLFDRPLNPVVVKKIPESVARRYGAIAVSQEGNKLYVAMSDPLNVFAIDDLKMITGMEIEPLLALEDEINQAINRYYQLEESVSQVLGDIATDDKVSESDYKQLQDIENVEDDAPIIRLVNTIISRAVRERASDIHIEPMENTLRVRFRIDGVLHEVMSLPRNAQNAIISRIKIMANLDIAEHRLPQDGRIEVSAGGRNVDLRVSILPTIFGEKVVIRILDKSSFILQLPELGFSDDVRAQIERLIKKPNGMLLVTGPTGSGKTTTLYALLSRLNRPEENIITVEDPVEYRLDGINQVQVNPKIGLTFAEGLRAILRQDPNIIMVGEIRDRETADIAVRAALTGHLVLSTLHTNDAAGALARLVDMGVEPFLIASSVLAVTAQRLVRKICPNCKEPYRPGPDDPVRLLLNLPPDENITLYRGRGCGQCNNTGYYGRVAIHELMLMNGEIRRLVNQRASRDEIKEAAIRSGMRTLFQDGVRRVMAGETTVEEVLKHALIDD